MKELTVEITNESGLHARPATAFTQLAAKFASKVTIAANGCIDLGCYKRHIRYLDC